MKLSVKQMLFPRALCFNSGTASTESIRNNKSVSIYPKQNFTHQHTSECTQESHELVLLLFLPLLFASFEA